jgi:hypothetical protein
MSTKKQKSKNEAAPSTTNELIASEVPPDTEPESIAEIAVDKGESVPTKKNNAGKIKVIRDSFSFPEQDYRKISELKKTCLMVGIQVKKSEILRAGLNLLSQLNLDELKQSIEKVEKVQTGRPSQKNG